MLIDVGGPVDLVRTLAPLAHHAQTMHLAPGEVWRATRTPDGPATIRLRQITGTTVRATAWGPGHEWALHHAPALVGVDDDPGGFTPNGNPLLRDLHRRFAGIRLPRAHAVTEALVPIVLEQKVQTAEAQASYRILIARHGEPAPGPSPMRLRLPPDPRTLAHLPYWHFHRAGVEKRRTDTIRRIALCAPRLDEAATTNDDEVYRRMTAIPGIGPWTRGEVGMRALGDADAVPVGDYHLPHLVSFALAGEPRADDARMLELLEPYRPHRARVVRLLVSSGIRAPRYGPRMPRSLLSRVGSARPARAAAG